MMDDAREPDDFFEDDRDPVHLTPQERYNLYLALVGQNLLPFDVQYMLTNNLSLFGDFGNGPLIGKYVKIHGPELVSDGRKYNFEGKAGFVIGDYHGRIVVQVSEGFLGWLTPDQFEVINIFPVKEISTIN